MICIKWGNRYGPLFVNRLLLSIKRHTKLKTRLICFTDDDSDIDKEVICYPLPEIKIPPEISSTPWRKMSVWQYPLYDLNGDILFLDLDLVLTGNIDRFFTFKPGHYCVIENWTQKGMGIGNTSCFRFPAGKYKNIYEDFEKNSYKIWKEFHIEQIYLSKKITKQVFWPEDWCLSFKHNLLPSWPIRYWKAAELPQNTSIVAFTGKPDPDDVIKGQWPVKKIQFYKKIYKYLRAPKWVSENWS